MANGDFITKIDLSPDEDGRGFYDDSTIAVPGWNSKAYSKAHPDKKTPWGRIAIGGAVALVAGILILGSDEDAPTQPSDSAPPTSVAPIIDLQPNSLPPSGSEGIAPVGSTLAPIIRNTVVVTAAP
jgi:hypothetical protein